MGTSADFVFSCPECGESMEVNESMKDALIENGCVICGAPITDDEFRRTDESGEE